MNTSHPKVLFRYLSLLDKLGYYPVNSSHDRLIYTSIKNSFEQMGKSYSSALVRNMCSLYGLSEYELFSNYDLFKKTLYLTLGEGEANGIITSIKKELLAHAILNGSNLTVKEMTNPALTIEDILEDIDSAETLRFVAETAPHQHILFLYRNEEARDRLLSAFFSVDKNATVPMYHFSQGPCLRLSNITYEKLLEKYLALPTTRETIGAKTEEANKDRIYWKSKLCLSNNMSTKKYVRAAEEDIGYWLKKGFTTELIELENFIGRNPAGNMSVMCGLNISGLADEDLSRILKDITSCHGHVIMLTGKTFHVYSAEPNNVEIQKRRYQGAQN